MLQHIISWVVFLPLLGIPLVFALPKDKAKWVTLAVTLVDFVIAIPLFTAFNKNIPGLSNPGQMQFVEQVSSSHQLLYALRPTRVTYEPGAKDVILS